MAGDCKRQGSLWSYPCGRAFCGMQLHSIVSGDGPRSSTLQQCSTCRCSRHNAYSFWKWCAIRRNGDGSCTLPSWTWLAALILEPYAASNEILWSLGLFNTHLGVLICSKPLFVLLFRTYFHKHFLNITGLAAERNLYKHVPADSSSTIRFWLYSN